MSVPVIKALTLRIRKRIGTNAETAIAADVSGGQWSNYEAENCPTTTIPVHRFLMVANDAEKQALIDLIRVSMEGGDKPKCAQTEASETTEEAAELQRAVRAAMSDGKLTPLERKSITEQALTVKASADDVIQAVGEGV